MKKKSAIMVIAVLLLSLAIGSVPYADDDPPEPPETGGTNPVPLPPPPPIGN